ncbi:hypothetical protein FQA39_LY18980 [Lamprigera yunnana]|nr:hypothetical protein FQA39_LY18980 [Lamprigera yunnana]
MKQHDRNINQSLLPKAEDGMVNYQAAKLPTEAEWEMPALALPARENTMSQRNLSSIKRIDEVKKVAIADIHGYFKIGAVTIQVSVIWKRWLLSNSLVMLENSVKRIWSLRNVLGNVAEMDCRCLPSYHAMTKQHGFQLNFRGNVYETTIAIRTEVSLKNEDDVDLITFKQW